MNRARIALLLAACLGGPAWEAAAHDVILTRKKERLEGTIVSETEQEVKFYPYFSRLPGIEYEVVTLARREIARVEKVEDKLQETRARLAKLAADDLKGRLELARWCVENKLETEKAHLAETVLAVAPENADALALLSDKEKKEFLKTPPGNPALRERLTAYLGLTAKDARAAEYAALKKDFGISEPQVYYDRMVRSALQPKGLRQDVKLTLLSDKITGVYTIFVPDGYDPTRPWPLVVGLHGGGPDGADGKGVVGSGKEFMNFIQSHCGERGYLAVCPTARAAPWSAPDNDAWFLTVIREVQMLYHVDLNRVYLMGHSMGGFGTWHFGPKYCEQFAAIAPASGGGNNGHKKLATTHTAVYVYHSNDDPRCRVDDSREAAKIMKKTGGLEFIYTELPNRQHDFPQEVVTDIFEYFARHRLWLPPGAKNARPSREPRSSFLVAPAADEMTAFPFPDEGGDEGGKPEIKKLMETLVRGGGNGEKAAERLAELKDASAVPMLGKVLTAPGLAGPDARGFAAWVLGETGQATGVKHLLAALKDKEQSVRTRAVEALGKLGDAKSVAPVVASLKELQARFDSRTQAKGMDLTDWDALMADLVVYAGAFARFREPKTLADLHAAGVTKMLLAPIQVRYDKEVEAGPAGSKRAAAEALVAAFEAIGTPAAGAPLDEIARGMEGESVAELARAAAAKVRS